MPELTLMLDIRYMVPVLHHTNQFASIAASQNITWTDSAVISRIHSPQITANALKYCPCPYEAQASFDRKTVFKNKRGECRRELLICTFEGGKKILRMPPKPPNPSKVVRSQAGTQKAETPSVSSGMFLHQLWVHTRRNKCVRNYSLAGSCFLVSWTSEEKKGEKDPAPSSETHVVVFFLYSGNHVQSPANKCPPKPCGRSEVERSVHQNLPLHSDLVCL